MEIPEFRDVMDRIFSQVAGVEDRTKFYNKLVFAVYLDFHGLFMFDIQRLEEKSNKHSLAFEVSLKFLFSNLISLRI